MSGKSGNRQAALLVTCPRCGAAPEAPCVGARLPPQPRRSVHLERIALALSLKRKQRGGP